MRNLLLIVLLFFGSPGFSQQNAAATWADSVLKTLSPDEQIAQLMIVRLSTIDQKTKTITFFDSTVSELVKQYNIGGVCLFQGNPVKQATMINTLQAIAKTPILMCIDAEWGLGMRMTDSVLPLPKQMMLGAMQDSSIVYQYGKLVAEQCRRTGIQVNFAPVVDVNNNPDNPVINDRSFGENKYKVAEFGIQYMKGLQDNGVMACAKHFPGHGDVSVDSHYDLPVIKKTMPQLEALELYPFKKMFKAGVGSVMIAHLYIPAIDSSANRATSLSKNTVTQLMRTELGYQGLTFTDALEMQGVKKFFPDGAASVESLIAGNDMLCLPGDVPVSIAKIKLAIDSGRLSWADIAFHCKKVLMAKFEYGLAEVTPVNTDNLTADLNSGVENMRRLVAENAITVLSKTDSGFFPLSVKNEAQKNQVAYVGIGINADNAFSRRLQTDYNAKIFYFDYAQPASRIRLIIDSIKKQYTKVIIGVHNYNRSPVNNFGISNPAVELVKQLQQMTTNITFIFGNAYAVKNWCAAKNLVVCYEDDSIVQNTAVDLMEGQIPAKGKLPVTVCENFTYGSGLSFSADAASSAAKVSDFDFTYFKQIDSLANNAVEQGATPGAVVLVAKDGKLAYYKAYGTYTYENKIPVNIESVYDIASVTKICATTISIMRLYDEGKIDLKKNLGDYLPWVKGSNKEKLTIENILLHQAGLSPFIPFYKETIDAEGIPLLKYYSTSLNDSFRVKVAQNLYLRNDWPDSMANRILESPLGRAGKYVYSDNDFIFLGKLVEAVSGVTLDAYTDKTFYRPMGLTSIGFKPLNRIAADRIVPTEKEKQFRFQLLQGYVHDPGAAMFGGVAGHAGLFSNAYDLSVIMQMLLNGGTFNGVRYLSKEVINLFTAYHSVSSRRGYGFDKPEKDNKKRSDPYPCLSASPLTFGHTGFTGTCVWADPAYNLIFVFLSNRVNPDGGDNRKLISMNVRSNIQELIYKSLGL